MMRDRDNATRAIISGAILASIVISNTALSRLNKKPLTVEDNTAGITTNNIATRTPVLEIGFSSNSRKALLATLFTLSFMRIFRDSLFYSHLTAPLSRLSARAACYVVNFGEEHG